MDPGLNLIFNRATQFTQFILVDKLLASRPHNRQTGGGQRQNQIRDYYNRAAQWQRGVAINYKWDAFKPGTAVYDIERGTTAGAQPEAWQNDTAVSRGAWCWIAGQEFKSVATLISELADVVSKNGNLLLNVGPKLDGTISEGEQKILREIGAWLSVNGEAIYGTRPWTIAAEGPTAVVAGSFVDGEVRMDTARDIRFTTRKDVTGDYVYAILLARPDDGVARVRAFGTGSGLLTRGIQAVSVVGEKEPLDLSRVKANRSAWASSAQ